MQNNQDNIQSIICNYLCQFGRLSQVDLKLLLNCVNKKSVSDSKIEFHLNELKRINAIKQDENNELYSMPSTNSDDLDSMFLPDYIIHRCLITLRSIASNLKYIDLIISSYKPVTVSFRGVTNENQELFFEIIYVRKDEGNIITHLVDAYDYFKKSGFSTDINNAFYENSMSCVRRYLVIEDVEEIKNIGIHHIYSYVIIVDDTPLFKIIGGENNSETN